MELQKLVSNLMVEDVNKTVQFYEDVLDYILGMNFPEDGQWDWALMKRDGVELMFQSKKTMAKELFPLKDKPVGGTISLYVTVDDVKAYHKLVKDKVKIIRDLHPTEYGTEEFSFEDCNGYILIYAQRLR